jgi:hypothetical protein
MRRQLAQASLIVLTPLAVIGATSCGDDDACAVPPCAEPSGTTAGNAGSGNGGAGGIGAGGMGAVGGMGAMGGNGNGGVGGVDPCDECEGLTPFCNAADECVACLNSTHCGGNACNPEGICSDFGTTQAACDECDTDSNCVAGHVCVAMTFPQSGGTAVGSFCQPVSAGACGDATRPYSLLAEDVVTADGVMSDVCTLETTTCQGVKDKLAAKGCAMDDQCGVAAQSDGLCRSNGQPMAPDLCTYPCTLDEHCPVGIACLIPANYCQQP